MKRLFTNLSPGTYLLCLLAFAFFGQLSAQSNLSTSTVPTRINYENGTEFTDYIIPNVGGRISFTLNGGGWWSAKSTEPMYA